MKPASQKCVFDALAKSPFSVIPADPGSRPGQAPESSVSKDSRNAWTPFFNGVTTSYQGITICFS